MAIFSSAFLFLGQISYRNIFIFWLLFVIGIMHLVRKHNYRMSEYLVQTQSYQEKLNLLNSELKVKDKLLVNLPDQIAKINFFKRLIDKLIKINDVDEVYRIVTNEFKSVFSDVDTVMIYLLNRGTLHLVYSSKSDGFGSGPIKHKKGDMLDYWVLKQNKELLIEDLSLDFRFDNEKIESLKERPISSLLSSPMFLGRKSIGIIRIESFRANAFSYDDLRILSVLSDIAALAIDRLRIFRKVEDLAIKDSLTGLYLKGYFIDRVKQELSRASVNNQFLSIIMIDIDFFKSINDEYGHIVGDMVIKKLAHTLHAVVGASGGIVSRFGGEEFVILMQGASVEKALTVAENLRLRVEAEPILFRRKKIAYTISLGVAGFPTNAKYPQDLIQAADDALYEAKKQGRNKVCSA